MIYNAKIMTLQFEPIPSQTPERRIGRRDTYFIQYFTEDSNADLAKKAWEVHGEGYVNEGFVAEDALLDDGALPTDIDKARGQNVEYYLATGREVTRQDGSPAERATMRKINIPEGERVSSLPAFQLCKDTLYPEYRDYLESIENPAGTVKEIAALARTKEASPMAVFELLRDGLQDSLGEDGEIWFFSIVSQTYDSMVENFGPDAVKQIGEPVSLDDLRVNDEVKLVPAMVNTTTFIDQLRSTIEATTDSKRFKQLTRSFMFFTEGVPTTNLSNESAEFRAQVSAYLEKSKSGIVA